MPPKQATLGYVRHPQQTLGCETKGNLFSDRQLTLIWNRKFFGLRDGVSPKKQQSTLAFKSSPKPDKKVEEDAEAVKTENEVKAEVKDLDGTNGGNEDLESVAGEEIEEQKYIKAESSSIGNRVPQDLL